MKISNRTSNELTPLNKEQKFPTHKSRFNIAATLLYLPNTQTHIQTEK